jgi:formate dehydrogenase maturation protein FdhE
MTFEACPACVSDPDELILKPGENSGPRLVLCDVCGNTGLVLHEC